MKSDSVTIMWHKGIQSEENIVTRSAYRTELLGVTGDICFCYTNCYGRGQ